MAKSLRTFEAPFANVPGAVAEIRAGRMLVEMDNAHRQAREGSR